MKPYQWRRLLNKSENISCIESIGIVGSGFVGRAIANGFKLYCSVKTYDIDPLRATHSLESTLDSDVVFVCLPTPMTYPEGGECDLSIIQGFFESCILMPLAKVSAHPIFVIKSTVPVGTVDKLSNDFPNLKIVHSPEFLTARTACIDFVTPSRNIVGGCIELTARVAKLYRERFPGVACLEMAAKESEMVKYAMNAFFAVKVTFFNELRLLADAEGVDWTSLMAGILSDGRISHMHTDVPGHDGQRGYGGACFAKDINAFIRTMESHGIDPKLLKASWDQNKAIRKDWDWVRIKSAVSDNPISQ